ncbi:hypothetical protein B7494_g2841 [Chlorociboria aeruginascens]|nr:hypothetical protein B7494_g2841 [Chlorociboria aeruginascens]
MEFLSGKLSKDIYRSDYETFHYKIEKAGKTDSSKALPVVKEYFPESIVTELPDKVEVQTTAVGLDASKAEETFGIKFKSFEEQVKELQSTI